MEELEKIFEFLIPIVLYAEIHSKLPPIPNILDNRLPEIIADAPQRVDKNNKLPILILIKDSHLYPLELLSIRLRIEQGEVTIQEVELLEKTLILDQRLWYRLFEVDPGTEGWVKLGIVFTVKNKGKTLKLKNHSYRWIKKEGLNVYISSDVLPASHRILYGDIHCHSFFTEDVVEFGAPIDATAKLAKAMGLAFLAVTDHSYDLDDEISHPMTNDPQLQKWKNFVTECSSIEDGGLTVLPGIEVSAGNKSGKNVHLLVLNPERFYPGKGDGAEVWLKNKPDNSVSYILMNLGAAELAIAAHPFRKIFFLERWLLRRGHWSFKDAKETNLAGLQIFNGIDDASLKKGILKWVEILLEGHKKFIYAGNDAHGNFNRFIQIKIPFVLLKRDEKRVFGFMKTGIYAKGRIDRESLTVLLKKGRCFVTTGPSIYFFLFDTHNKFFPGDTTRGRDLTLFLEVESIKEFGDIKSVSIILGDLIKKTEKQYVLMTNKSEFLFKGKLPFSELPPRFYIRIACEAENGMAFSNPVWVRD